MAPDIPQVGGHGCVCSPMSGQEGLVGVDDEVGEASAAGVEAVVEGLVIYDISVTLTGQETDRRPCGGLAVSAVSVGPRPPTA